MTAGGHSWLRRPWAVALDRPWLTLACCVFLVVANAPGVLQLQIRTDGHALVPEQAAAVKIDAEVRELFDLEDPLAVTLETSHTAGIFNAASLAGFVELARAIEDNFAADSQVISLASEKGGRVVPGTLDFRPYLDPLPQTDAEIERLREDLWRTRIYTGTLLSVDGAVGRPVDGDAPATGAPSTWAPSATAILIGTPSGIDRFDFYQRLTDVVARHTPADHITRVVGAPAAEVLLGRHLLEDLALLIPLAAAIMTLVFLVAFRSLAAALLGGSEVGACLIFVFGVLGYCGVPVYLTIAVLPVILTVVGVADEIHLFHRFQQQLAAAPSRSSAAVLRDVLPELAPAILRTSLTSGIAFTSFCLSPLAAVQAFGAFAAVGIAFCMLWSLLAIPAALVLIPTHFLLPRRPRQTRDHWQPFAAWVTRHRALLIGCALIGVTVAALQLPRVTVQDSWVDGFAPGDPFAIDTRRVNELFHGTHILEVCIDTRPGIVEGRIANTPPEQRALPREFELSLPPRALPPAIGQSVIVRATAERLSGQPRLRGVPYSASPFVARVSTLAEGGVVRLERPRDPYYARYQRQGPFQFEVVGERWLDPEVLAACQHFEEFLKQLPTTRSSNGPTFKVGGILGPHEQLSTVNYIAGAYRPERRTSGASARENEEILDHYDNVRGPERRHQLIDERNQQGRLTLFLKDADFVSTAHLIETIRQYEHDHLTPRGIALRFGGDVAVSQSMIQAVVDTQLRSLFLSLIGVLIVASLLHRSLLLGALATLPASLAVVMSGAGMVLFDIPLGVATSMFAGMTLGIGVDYAIHYLARWKRQQRLGDPAAVANAIQTVGRPILIDVVVIGLGFGVLIFSQVPANHRLGMLVLVSLVTCFVATVTVLPALLSWAQPRNQNRTHSPE